MMNASDTVKCVGFPCLDIRRESHLIHEFAGDPGRVSVVLVSEAAPENPADGYYAGPDALFARTTVLAFQDARAQVASIQDILDLGVYLTTAVKCAKTGYGIAAATIASCSLLLEKEIARFPNVKGSVSKISGLTNFTRPSCFSGSMSASFRYTRWPARSPPACMLVWPP